MLYLRFIRLSQGLTLRVCSNRARIPIATIQGIEKGRVNPRADELERLAAVLNVRPDLLTKKVRVPELEEAIA